MNYLLNIAFLILISLIFIINYGVKKNKDLFEPLNIYIAIFFVGYFINNLFLIKDYQIDKDILLNSQIIIFFGVLVFFMGYYLIRYSDRTVSKDEIFIISNRVLIIFYLLFWIFRLYGFITMSSSAMNTNVELTSTKNLESTLSGLSKYIYYMILINNLSKIKLKKDFKAKCLILIVTLIEIIYGFLNGWKATIISVLICFALIYNYIIGRIRIKKLILPIICTLSTMGLVFPIMTMYRVVSITSTEGSSTLTQSFENLKTSIELVDNQDNMNQENIVQELIDRVGYGESLYNVINGIENVGFQYGKTFSPVLTWYIPRFLYPDKPKSSIGHWYAVNFLGWDPNKRSEGAITIIGDIYVNFGYIGIIIGMFSYGILLKYLYERLKPSKGRPFDILLYILFIENFVIKFEQNLGNIIISFMYNLIILYILYNILYSQNRLKINKKRRLNGIRKSGCNNCHLQ